MTTPMQPAIGLIRVSTDRQAQGSDSPEVQEDRIRQWALLTDHEIVAIYGRHDEGISGYIPAMEREDAKAAIEHAVKLKAPLVCYSLSRLGRNAADLLLTGQYLVKYGSNLIAISDGFNLRLLMQSAMGKFLFGVQALAAQLWRDTISQDTSNALQRRRQNHCRVGQVPYGWEIDMTRPETRVKDGRETVFYPHQIRNEHEQAVIAQIRAMHSAGLSNESIAGTLTEGHIRTKKGCLTWSRRQIARILANGNGNRNGYEQAVIAQVRAMHSAGLSNESIAGTLNDE
ncbi:MAG: recombinase family protein [Acidobacteriota bacterium]